MNNQMGFTPKDLKFGEDGRVKLKAGIEKIANAVKSTLGPRGNTVLIESQHHTGGITVTKDGVTVAKAVDLLDPVENLAVRIMKEAADRTASSAGDGTTTAIVLTEALVEQGHIHLGDGVNNTQVLRELVSETEQVVKTLKKKSKNVTDSKLLDVATISANNDAKVGRIISDVYKSVGKDGIVTVEKSDNSETTYTTTKGLMVERGYSSPLFINNQKKDECILEDVHILVSDAEITNILQIENVLKPIIAENKKLLLIAPCATNVLNTLAANVMKNNLKICSITPPQFGYKQHELMQDIAISVGATYFSEKTGDDLSLMGFDDLGHAPKVIVEKSQTVILKDDNHSDEIDERVKQLWDSYENTSRVADKEFILSRIASLTGGVGVIKVGGQTDLEQKELFDRIDDAVCAVRSAMQEGILPGGGVSLMYIGQEILKKQTDDKNKKIAYAILGNALQAPVMQILDNAGYHINDVYPEWDIKFGEGYNVASEKFGNMIRMGVIDPMKVTKSALQNAVSVAVTLLSTNAIITMARTYDTE